uniref:uncharacterized protein LOC120808266 isoform X5 n=1 Tax=Gasterosteus aculeatus aculeatus TaxID=481459 RepID=UPI001A993139|nr:uncharacterized protein LOC120808266 isoform X5 [Gasterosteus aculeatus aculeatus]
MNRMHSEGYMLLRDDELQQRRVFGKNFFVHLAGKTNGAHGDVINYLKSIGKVQVESYAESDFLMVFCPVVSKVGTDIEAALSNNSVLTDGKPAVLVVMHHTFDPHHLVAESRRQVNDARVWLTVDCLFYQKNLLPCPLNDIMQKQVADFLGSSSGSLVPFWKNTTFMFGKNFFVHLAGKTNGAHGDVVNYLKRIGKVQVESYAESDFLMVFCPVVSQVATDIEAALSDNSVLTDGKPAVLVVMHHTFDPHHVVAESRRQVNDARVWLTVDCLFYQNNLLPCPLNDIMQKQVVDFLGSSSGSLVPFWPKNKFRAVCLVGVLLVKLITQLLKK